MIQPISSPDNKHIKAAAALRQKKQRDDTGLFLLEGLHLVEAAINAKCLIEQAFLCEDRLARNQFVEFSEKLLANGSQIFAVSSSVFNKIAETDTPQGIIAVARQCRADLSATTQPVEAGDCLPWVVLDAVQDPGNVGTIVRNADAAGVAGIVLTPGCADIYAAKRSAPQWVLCFIFRYIRHPSSNVLIFFWNGRFRFMLQMPLRRRVIRKLTGDCLVQSYSVTKGLGSANCSDRKKHVPLRFRSLAKPNH